MELPLSVCLVGWLQSKAKLSRKTSVIDGIEKNGLFKKKNMRTNTTTTITKTTTIRKKGTDLNIEQQHTTRQQ